MIRKKPSCTAILLTLVTTFFACDLLLRPGLTTPCRDQTAFYGPATSSNYTEIVEDQDDSTRISGMYYCIMYTGSTLQHFRGFRTTLEADTGTFYQSYGTLVDPVSYLTDNENHFCEYFDILEEIMYIEIYSDSNDCEGMVLFGHEGTVYSMRANGASSSPKFRMEGRPIGFGMYMGYGGTDNQPL